jgi:predicted cupin superfamily sugar epimerase
VDVRKLARDLDLAPHPEGGWFRETWRSSVTVPTPRGPRAAGTSILYLLGDGAVSRLHSLAWDEVWSLHAGGPLHLRLFGAGGLETVTLRSAAPARYQAVVRADTWFGAEPAEPGGWALVGCAMAPGYEPADFRWGDRSVVPAGHADAAAVRDRLAPPAEEAP